MPFQGYEIHLGETIYAENAQAFAHIRREGDASDRPDGAVARDRRAFGTYVHGLFSDDAFRHCFIRTAKAACSLRPPNTLVYVAAERQRRIDRLAAHVRAAIDMSLIRKCVGALR